MKKRHYKEIIEALENKLQRQISHSHILYKRMCKAEEENKMLREDLQELSKDFRKQNEDNNN